MVQRIRKRLSIASSQEVSAEVEAVVEEALAEDPQINVTVNGVKKEVTAEKEALDEEGEVENH